MHAAGKSRPDKSIASSGNSMNQRCEIDGADLIEFFGAFRVRIASGQIVMGSIENAFPPKAFND